MSSSNLSISYNYTKFHKSIGEGDVQAHLVIYLRPGLGLGALEPLAGTSRAAGTAVVVGAASAFAVVSFAGVPLAFA